MLNSMSTIEDCCALSQPRLTEIPSRECIGSDTYYRLANGVLKKRIYLDSAASTLQLKVVNRILQKYQPFYANTHTTAHFGAKLSTNEYDWAHRMVLEFVNADPERYTAFFVGSGTTAGINRIARTLRNKRSNRDLVISTIMEHHSNDLPHRKHFNNIIHVPVSISNKALGSVDLERLTAELKLNTDRVNYVAITGASNVTGIINPIHEVAEIAHKNNALIVVDAAQMAAHMPIKMSGHADPSRDIDALVFSGHKVYAPGAPGVVVVRKDLFTDVEPTEVGGGMVDDVYLNRYIHLNDFPDREEAGTPNISGAIALASALYCLQQIGLDHIEKEENRLIQYAIKRLKSIDNIIIYGDTDRNRCNRTGIISINLQNLHHSLTAQILNDYFNISVRNGCFCAHPYVRELISDHLSEGSESFIDEELEYWSSLNLGMVRVSFGIYNDEEDIDTLVNALHEIMYNQKFFVNQYNSLPNGEFKHKTFEFKSSDYFSAQSEVDFWMSNSIGALF